MKYLFFTLLLYLPFSSELISQSTELATYVTIGTSSDQYIYGELIEIKADSLLLHNFDIGVITLAKVDIKYFLEGKMATNRFEEESTNVSVPYYVQSALPNGKGNHYYKNYLIFGNEFNFGLSDSWNVSMGFETASLIFDSNGRFPTMQAGSKYVTPITKNLNVGLSAKYYFNNGDRVLMLGAPITLGNKRTNITLSPTRVHDHGSTYFGIFSNLSFDLSKNERLVVDYIRADNENISAIVFEHIFRSGFTLSLGVLITSEDIIPNMAFSVPFGSWKNKFRKKY